MEVVAALEGVLQDATPHVARIVVVHGDMTAHAAHPGVVKLVEALHAVAGVLARFDLSSVADPGIGALTLLRRQATEDFDTAFDEALATVHAARREVARVSLAASARGSALSPHVLHLRRELHVLQPFVDRSQALLAELARGLAAGAQSHGLFATATALARRTKGLVELHAAGRGAMDDLRDCEEAFAALVVRLKRELAPTYVEWKRLLAPVAMRNFAGQQLPLELPEVREVHALLQRQVSVACETAASFEAAQRRLEDSIVTLGRRARVAMDGSGPGPAK